MLSVILAFYAPCDYELPKQHLATTLKWLAGTGVSTILAQVVRPGQAPQPVPAGVQNLVYETPSVMFYKENLWNIAAQHTSADMLCFLDADVYFAKNEVLALRDKTPLDLFGSIERKLKRCDVIQPFETAMWLSQTGERVRVRKASAVPLAHNTEPAPIRYHPGFSWAMTRQAFDAMGGWYDRHPFGAGDTAFAYSLDPRWLNTSTPKHLPQDAQFWPSQSFQYYQANGVQAGLRVGYLETVDAYHRWHGDLKNRQYANRSRYVALTPGNEYPLIRRADGLLEWEDAETSAQVLEYFQSRKEDG